jgi:hypothetical protein
MHQLVMNVDISPLEMGLAINVLIVGIHLVVVKKLLA